MTKNNFAKDEPLFLKIIYSIGIICLIIDLLKLPLLNNANQGLKL